MASADTTPLPRQLADLQPADLQPAELKQAEAQTLAQLAELKQKIMACKQLPARLQYSKSAEHYNQQLQQLNQTHRQNKQRRAQRRSQAHRDLGGEALAAELARLQKESQQDGLEKRRLKRSRDEALLPFKNAIAQADQELKQLKHQYKALSADWQVRMQQAYFAAITQPAEFSLSILYQDNDLVVIDKPAGLLSVPGRRYAQQDSVVSRLRYQRCGEFVQATHRLDQATSGLLIIALSPQAHRGLAQQFAQNRVHKIYEAILSRPVIQTSGHITLPLWANPDHRPLQQVHWQKGKPSQTHFEVLCIGQQPRIQFIPHTGRTHQLRVHAAHPLGLNSPILGDPLYSIPGDTSRLYLHATELRFLHPSSKEPMHLVSAVPF